MDCQIKIITSTFFNINIHLRLAAWPTHKGSTADRSPEPESNVVFSKGWQLELISLTIMNMTTTLNLDMNTLWPVCLISHK